jgi:hypothetical protein
MSQPNKFAAALKGGSAAVAEMPVEALREAPAVQAGGEPIRTAKAPEKPSRRNAKHIGGYFDPAVSRQLRGIALEEDSTVQELMGEALDMLFQSRRKPTIARKTAGG